MKRVCPSRHFPPAKSEVRRGEQPPSSRQKWFRAAGDFSLSALRVFSSSSPSRISTSTTPSPARATTTKPQKHGFKISSWMLVVLSEALQAPVLPWLSALTAANGHARPFLALAHFRACESRIPFWLRGRLNASCFERDLSLPSSARVTLFCAFTFCVQ